MPLASSQSPHLNPAQREAVEFGDGPLLVLAGAGSGKTRVITHRIAWLIGRGIPASAIVALTFTNKAASEMRARVTKILGRERGVGRESAAAGGLTISTFHSFGLAVLGQEKSAIGGRFTIFDQGDQTSLVKQLLREAGAERAFDAQAVLARISNAKNAFQTPAELPIREGDAYDEVVKTVFPRYQEALSRYRALDFDDLVCEVPRLWNARADIRAKWQHQFLYVLVDEYQDTNRAQLEMLRLLCGPRKSICAVGDDDQAIYGWRGADVTNILDFENHFGGASVVKLEQNYRSTSPILAVANAVIAQRADARWRKVLFTDRAGGSPVRLAVASTPEAEAAWVAREIRRLLREEGQHASEIAVLYRSNAQSRPVEEALREQGVAHRVVGGVQFFERKEVKDVLAYLKLALNNADEISLRRILNYPPRAIGETTLEKLVTHSFRLGWSLWQAVERADALDDLPSGAREGCRGLERIVADVRRSLAANHPASEVARTMVDRLALKAEIEGSAASSDVAAKRWASIEGLLATLARRDAREGPTGGGLAAFLQLLTLDMQPDSGDASDVVTLSTLHGSKGLEYAIVFLIGCEEGYLPHTRVVDSRVTDAETPGSGAASLEEERRLFYVGITRARERLVLSRARARALRGKPSPRTPSRFLLDIPAELLEELQVQHEAPTTAREAAGHAEAILAMLKGL
jgi:ATP-dependent DNA helicase Rep